MNYSESVAYVESLAPTILNPSLARFSAFMEAHGKKQDAVPAIHVGGTNGKGSTVAIIDSVLRASGLKVGRFTGPHLLRWNERFHLDGKPISDELFASYATRLRALSEEFGQRNPEYGHLTWFEFLTALAFFYFTENKADVAVYEVGLGGRWDATNVLSRPLVCAITTIALDHTHILGSSIAEIAGEKAGIIKPNVPVVTATAGDALDVIAAKAADMRSPLYVCSAPHTVSGPQATDTAMFDEYCRCLSLLGEHQHVNALVAYAVLTLAAPPLGIDLPAHVSKGFSTVYWPGRLQYVPKYNMVMDGAHNVAGAAALRRALDELFPGRKLAFVLSFFGNKDVSGSINQLIRAGDTIYAGEAQGTRSICPAEQIASACRARGGQASAFRSISEALAAARKDCTQGELIVAAGSFATVKEAMHSLGWMSVEDGMPHFSPGCS